MSIFGVETGSTSSPQVCDFRGFETSENGNSRLINPQDKPAGFRIETFYATKGAGGKSEQE
jgi:hypothetical protein